MKTGDLDTRIFKPKELSGSHFNDPAIQINRIPIESRQFGHPHTRESTNGKNWDQPRRSRMDERPEFGLCWVKSLTSGFIPKVIQVTPPEVSQFLLNRFTRSEGVLNERSQDLSVAFPHSANRGGDGGFVHR